MDLVAVWFCSLWDLNKWINFLKAVWMLYPKNPGIFPWFWIVGGFSRCQRFAKGSVL